MALTQWWEGGEIMPKAPGESQAAQGVLCPLRRVASRVGQKPVTQGAESLLWSSICRPAVPVAGVWEVEVGWRWGCWVRACSGPES